jgi:hypothetical protein
MNGITKPKLTEQIHPLNDKSVEKLGKIKATNLNILYIILNKYILSIVKCK